MSFRVLVIPEDPTHNGYILKPVVERLLAEAGKPNARVLVLTNPKLGGYDDAVRAIKTELPDRYGFYDLWLFIPDADVASGLEALEAEAMQKGIRLICCAAQPELEAWVLAGFRKEVSLNWSVIKSHPRLKEEVFAPFLAKYGDSQAAGGGREKLMRQALQNFRGLTEICSELGVLEERIRIFISKPS